MTREPWPSGWSWGPPGPTTERSTLELREEQAAREAREAAARARRRPWLDRERRLAISAGGR